VGKVIVAVAVLVPVAALLAAWVWRVGASVPRTWGRRELQHAGIGAVLVVPAAVALGAVDGAAEGVGAFLLWGLLAGAFVGATRLEVREGRLDSDTRWLLDVSCFAFLAVTVFFSVVDFGYVFIPAACFLAVSWRFAHLRRRRRMDFRQASS